MSALSYTPPARPSSRRSSARSLAVYRTIRPDLVEVVVGGDVVGYLEIVGHVFVALRGDRYDRAVEVAQSMSIEVAHAALCSKEFADDPAH